ncbi:MAG: hypothetical protein AABY84_01120 [Candidatus Firestonebacteria bacterium]
MRLMQNKFTTIIFIIAITLRLLFLLLIPNIPNGVLGDDPGNEYNIIAGNIIDGKGFSLEPNIPTPSRAPFYPVFLSIIYAIFGYKYIIVRLIQCVVDSFTCVIIFFIAKNIFETTIIKTVVADLSAQKTADKSATTILKSDNNIIIPVLAALAVAMYPPFIMYANSLFSETLYSFLLAVFFLLFVVGINKNNYIYYIFAGVFMGLANLCRPITLLYPFLAILISLLIYKKKQTVIGCLIMLLASIIIIMPWTIRNQIQFKRFVPVTVRSGYNFWAGNYIPWDGYWLSWKTRDANLEKQAVEITNQIIKKADEKLTDVSSKSRHGVVMIDSDELFFQEGIKNIIQNPSGSLKLFIKKIYRFLFYPIGAGFLQERGHNLLFAVFVGVQWLIIGFAGYGFYRGFSEAKISIFFLVLIIYFTVSHSFLLVIPRYHLPIMPYILIFAIYGIRKLVFMK